MGKEEKPRTMQVGFTEREREREGRGELVTGGVPKSKGREYFRRKKAAV